MQAHRQTDMGENTISLAEVITLRSNSTTDLRRRAILCLNMYVRNPAAGYDQFGRDLKAFSSVHVQRFVLIALQVLLT